MSSLAEDIVDAAVALGPPVPLKLERYERIINDDGTITFNIYVREENVTTEAEVTITVNP